MLDLLERGNESPIKILGIISLTTHPSRQGRWFISNISSRTCFEEISALVVVRLASALVAVGVVTREAVHDVEVLGAGFVFTVAVFRKVAGVDGFPAWRSRNFELKTEE